MKIFRIKDKDNNDKTVAYLFYYEKDRRFYIELPDDAEYWETPMLLDSLLKQGHKSINSYWSKLWVQQRIIPPDRQNIGQILRDMKLDEYDEYALLIKYKGRCAQDNLYLEKISHDELAPELSARNMMHVEDICPITEHSVLVFFRDGSTRKINVLDILTDKQDLIAICKTSDSFRDVNVLPGGFGIKWLCGIEIAFDDLYHAGAEINLTHEDFVAFVQNNTVDTNEATAVLECSRQNIDELVSRNKLHPIKTSAKNKLFLKQEINERAVGGQ